MLQHGRRGHFYRARAEKIGPVTHPSKREDMMKKNMNLKPFGLVALLAFSLGFIGMDLVEGQVRTTRSKTENQTDTSQFANAKEKLISMGYNVPSELHKQEFVGSLDIPIDIKNRFFEILDAITGVLGSYPNFVYVAYSRNGTEADAKPVFDRLSEINFPLGEFTVAELQRRSTCLGGSNAGEPGTVTTEPYSVCIQHLEFIQNPFEHSPEEERHPDKVLGRRALNYAHEYFHHYERAHALDRGLNYQRDPENPQTTVDAPPWWTEGAAVAFQNAWYKANWSKFSFFQGKKWEDL